MAMSHDPKSKFRGKIIFLNYAFNIRKVTKFLVEKLSTLEVIGQKPHRGWKTYTFFTAFRVKESKPLGKLTSFLFIEFVIHRNFLEQFYHCMLSDCMLKSLQVL